MSCDCRQKTQQKAPWTLVVEAWAKDPALGCQKRPQLHACKLSHLRILKHMRVTHFALCAAKIVAITFFRNSGQARVVVQHEVQLPTRPCTPRVPIVNRYPQRHQMLQELVSDEISKTTATYYR
jgi:hypothetical protein